ncbi:MAG: DUF1189 family protein [Candidatus Omnitrophica bacterium]|nr:DUF1189 family protein [Candidatus Omnitrophota bacterium]
MFGLTGSFNSKFYSKIAKQPLGKSVGFLILFIALISLVLSLKHVGDLKSKVPEVTAWVHKNFENIISDLPDIEVKDGKLTLPRNPYIKEWDDKFAVIIRPQDDNFYGVLEGKANAFVLSKTKMAIKSTKSDFEQSEIKTYSLEQIEYLKISRIESGLEVTFGAKAFEVTPPTIESFLRKMFLYVYPIAFLWLLLAYSFVKTSHLLIFSIFSAIVNNQLKASLDYANLINIGIYALVPPVVLAVVFEVLGLKVPMFWLIYCVVYGLYLYLGIKSTQDQVEVLEVRNG